MKIYWRESVVNSLKQLDKWRKNIDLRPAANYLIKTTELYFQKQDFLLYIPGVQVFIRGMPLDLRMVLISIGTSDPNKIFYQKPI